MYNRYIRNDNGVYDRVPQQETAPPPRPEPRTQPPPPPRPGPPPPGPEPAPPPAPAPERQFLNRLLAKLHLGDMDAGDLLLLLILFFLFYQKADEEVLIAIGLLLILQETVPKGQSPFGTKGLQPAARIIGSLMANQFHTCSLRSIFGQVHALAENDPICFAACGRQTLRGFFSTQKLRCREAAQFFMGRFTRYRRPCSPDSSCSNPACPRFQRGSACSEPAHRRRWW